MALQHITIKKEFNAPVETVFGAITDHEAFGDLLPGTTMTRVVDSLEENVNGLGSIRLVKMPLSDFEETVVTFEPNKRMEYTITKGSPIKNHLGRLNFSENDGKTLLDYTIQLESKLPIPFFGAILKSSVEKSIVTALNKLADQY